MNCDESGEISAEKNTLQRLAEAGAESMAERLTGVDAEDTAAERLALIGQKILAAARDELYLGNRFLDVALSSFVYEMDASVSPFGTDGTAMYFHPRELGGLYRENRILVNRGYLHMVYHCLFRHLWKSGPGSAPRSSVAGAKRTLYVAPRSDSAEQESGTDEAARGDAAVRNIDERYWDLCCDIAAERLVDGNYHRSVRFSRSLLRRETYRKLEAGQVESEAGQAESEAAGKTAQASAGARLQKDTSRKKVLNAERIYHMIRGWQLSEKELARLEQEFYVDDHRYWANKQPDRKPPNPQQEQRWQEINEQAETDLETFSKEAAEKSGELLGQMKVENRERQDYREFLRKFSVIREEPGVDVDTFDYTFYCYGLSLYGNLPLIEPMETKEVKKVEEFAVVIDTSMSCSGDLVRKFLETTYDVLSGNENFFKKVNVHIIQCDEQVHSDVKITCEEELKKYMETLALYGGGGTDFRPAFAHVDELVRQGEFEDLRGLIYFTDGYGIYPRKMPGYQTAFVFLEEDYNDAEVPAWAMKVALEQDGQQW